jgi:hypothetical protein
MRVHTHTLGTIATTSTMQHQVRALSKQTLLRRIPRWPASVTSFACTAKLFGQPHHVVLPIQVTTAFDASQADEWVRQRLLPRGWGRQSPLPTDDDFLSPPSPFSPGRLAVRPRATESTGSSIPRVIGFDSEEVPSFYTGGRSQGICLVQLCCGNDVMLMPVRTGMELPPLVQRVLETDAIVKAGVGIEDDAKQFAEQFGVHCRALLEVSLPHTLAVLCRLLNDSEAHDLGRSLGAGSDQLPPELRIHGLRDGDVEERDPLEGLVAIPAVKEAVEKLPLLRRCNKISLVRLAAHWCGVSASWKTRRVQISDWRLLPLTEQQARYAAMDAWAGSAIAFSLHAAGVLDDGLAKALSQFD